MIVPKLALTFEEAAEACGYSVRTLMHQVAAGSLLARYANSKGVIRVEDLAQWLDELPTEPKGGHRPVSGLDEDEKGVAITDALGRPKGVISSDAPGGAEERVGTTDPTPKPRYRKPEEVAPELGMNPTELRRYCRESGIHTRLSQNRIMLSQEDIEKLLAWVTHRQAKAEWWKESEPERDPFA